MNKFFARIKEFFKNLFGGDRNMELPKIEVPPVVVEEPSKFQTNPVANPPAYTLVAVRPTGVNGIGKVRFYPMAPTGPKANLFGYLVNLADTIDVTNGKPFLNAQAKAEVANLMIAVGGATKLPTNPADWPAYADAQNFPDDWKSQEQLDAMNPVKQENAYYDNPVPVSTLSDEDKIYLHALNRTYHDIYFYFLRGYNTEILREISVIDSNFAAESAAFDVNNYHGSLLYWAPQALARWTKDHAKWG